MAPQRKYWRKFPPIRYRSVVEKKQILKFLLGINHSLDEVRGRLLGTKPLPSLRAMFSEVRHEELLENYAGIFCRDTH